MAYGDQAPGDDLLDSMHIGAGNVLEPLRLEQQSLIPVLLVLAGKAGHKAVMNYSRHQRTEDGPEGIPKAPVKEIGPQGVDDMTIGAAKALHPEGLRIALKIPLHIAMAPDAGRVAGQAALWPGPRILFAKLK